MELAFKSEILLALLKVNVLLNKEGKTYEQDL